MRRRLALAMGLAALGLLPPAVVAAHPLGNFTINRYNGLRVGMNAVVLDHVLDMAEIPTFSERAAMDADHDGTVSAAEAAAYATQACDALPASLNLAAGGSPLRLDLTERGIGFPQGQGAVTMRLVCVFSAALPATLSGTATAFTFSDATYADRRGWREVVVQGDGATLKSSDAPSASVSNRLTAYPADLLTLPSDQHQATFNAVSGGPALPPLDVPDAEPIPVAVSPGGTPPVGAPAPSAAPVEVPAPVVAPVPTPAAAAVAAVPNGVTDLGGDVTALFQTADLTPWVIALSLLVAAGLGALHAVSPGHGKTVMAAYLVGTRGSARQALMLGLVVTVSHTIGVLALGLISLSFAFVIPPDRLYPILGVVSGAIVICIGTWLIWQRIREARAIRREARQARLHAATHAAGTLHEHPHEHEHAEAHPHEHQSQHGHARDEAGDEGWHSHGGRRHTHLPPKGTTVTTRGLIALGLAGGMVPSVSALIVLLGSMSAGRPVFGIVLTIAFGVGMAIVLVGVGLGLVYARGLVERLASGKRSFGLMRWLPTVTAVVVVFAGTLMTVQALQLAR